MFVSAFEEVAKARGQEFHYWGGERGSWPARTIEEEAATTLCPLRQRTERGGWKRRTKMEKAFQRFTFSANHLGSFVRWFVHSFIHSFAFFSFRRRRAPLHFKLRRLLNFCLASSSSSSNFNWHSKKELRRDCSLEWVPVTTLPLTFYRSIMLMNLAPFLLARSIPLWVVHDRNSSSRVVVVSALLACRWHGSLSLLYLHYYCVFLSLLPLALLLLSRYFVMKGAPKSSTRGRKGAFSNQTEECVEAFKEWVCPQLNQRESEEPLLRSQNWWRIEWR